MVIPQESVHCLSLACNLPSKVGCLAGQLQELSCVHLLSLGITHAWQLPHPEYGF